MIQERAKRTRGICLWCGKRRLLDDNGECDDCFKVFQAEVERALALYSMVILYGVDLVMHEMYEAWNERNEKQP